MSYYNLYIISGINRSGVTTIGRFCIPYFLSYNGVKLGKNKKNCHKFKTFTIFDKIPTVIELDEISIDGLKDKINTELLRNNVLLLGHHIPQSILPVIPKYHIHLVIADNRTQLYNFCAREICNSGTDEIIKNYHNSVSEMYITHKVKVFKSSKRRKILSIVSEIMDIFSYKDIVMNFSYYINRKFYHKFIENGYFYLSKIEIDDFLPINAKITLISDYGALELQIIDMKISLPSDTNLTIYYVKPIKFGPDKTDKYRLNITNDYYLWDNENRETDLSLLQFIIKE